MASLAEIRAKLAAQDNKKSGNASNFDVGSYPFWNIATGETATLRFLPDADPKNTFFWVERQSIRLTFPGIAGGENKPVIVTVPCGEMYGDVCPILSEVRPWFESKDETMADLGRKYWKKRSYIFQGFVTDSPLQEKNVPENPIRRFILVPQVFNLVKSALMDPEMDNVPTDYVNGVDFKLSKTTKGSYADYGTSKWARKERALSQDELAAIDKFGLWTLKDFLPVRPTSEHYAAIAQMFEASVNGDLYDPERWGKFYKPYGLKDDAAPEVQAPSVSAQSAPKASAPVVTKIAETEADDVPFDHATPIAAEPQKIASTPSSKPAAGKKTADDILSMIRNRKVD